jgi:hypothetical protein
MSCWNMDVSHKDAATGTFLTPITGYVRCLALDGAIDALLFFDSQAPS